MRPFNPNLAFGELVINDVSAHTYAWCAIDIRDLYYPAKFRGQNRIVPGASGRRALPYRIDENDIAIPFYFTGVCDPSGNPYEDRFQGYEANIDLISDAWLTPGTPTLDAVITNRPSGDSDLSAAVQVVAFSVGSTDELLNSPFVWRATLGLRIPTGRFV